MVSRLIRVSTAGPTIIPDSRDYQSDSSNDSEPRSTPIPNPANAPVAPKDTVPSGHHPAIYASARTYNTPPTPHAITLLVMIVTSVIASFRSLFPLECIGLVGSVEKRPALGAAHTGVGYAVSVACGALRVPQSFVGDAFVHGPLKHVHVWIGKPLPSFKPEGVIQGVQNQTQQVSVSYRQRKIATAV